MTKRLARACIAWVAAAMLTACIFRPPGPPPASPDEICRGVQDSLNAAVPPGESIADLQARGVRLKSGLNFPPGTAPRPAQSGGAAVRLMIAPDGTVVPGSPKTVKSIGESQIASALEAAALSMSFDFDAGAKPAMPIAFTTTFAACRS
jgi:hypothetical protein